MRYLGRSIAAPGMIAVGFLLSACAGAALQNSLMPRAAFGDSAISTAGVRLLYAQSTNPIDTTSGTDAPIPGMAITLPAASTSGHNALVTFDAALTDPQSSAICSFTIYNNSIQTSISGSTYSSSGSNTYTPLTLVARIPLTAATQKVTVDWNNGGTGICYIEKFYSLSAIVTN